MTTLSLTLPKSLDLESQEIAGEVGISRTQFIRQAILHEIQRFRIRREQDAMIKSFSAMKHNREYLKMAQDIQGQFNTELPYDGEEWWKKTSS